MIPIRHRRQRVRDDGSSYWREEDAVLFEDGEIESAEGDRFSLPVAWTFVAAQPGWHALELMLDAGEELSRMPVVAWRLAHGHECAAVVVDDGKLEETDSWEDGLNFG